MPEDEKLYTLAQAKPLILRERCAREGHEIGRRMFQRDADGRIVIEGYGCGHCDVVVALSYPPS